MNGWRHKTYCGCSNFEKKKRRDGSARLSKLLKTVKIYDINLYCRKPVLEAIRAQNVKLLKTVKIHDINFYCRKPMLEAIRAQNVILERW